MNGFLNDGQLIEYESIPTRKTTDGLFMLKFYLHDFLGIVLLPLFAFPCILSAQPETADEPKTEVTSKFPPAPQPYSELMEVGQASIELYDPKTDPREFDGETLFTLAVKYRFRYTYKTRSDDAAKIISVRPRFSDITIHCTNKIYIPESYQGDRFWKSRLVDHEFEHVRLNCDVRPKLLAQALLKKLGKFDIRLEEGKEFTEAMINEKVSQYVTDVRTEVIRIMQAENDYLDVLTKHGLRRLENFDKFYADRYSKETLEGYKFKYLKETESLLDSKEYAREKSADEK